jgi:hypothetical protein
LQIVWRFIRLSGFARHDDDGPIAVDFDTGDGKTGRKNCLSRAGYVGFAKSAWTARHNCLQKDAKALNAFTRIIAASARVAGFAWTFFSGYSDPNCLLRFCRRVFEFEARGFEYLRALWIA